MRRRGFWGIRKLSEAGFTGFIGFIGLGSVGVWKFGSCQKRDLQDLWDFRDWGTCDESHDYEQEGNPLVPLVRGTFSVVELLLD